MADTLIRALGKLVPDRINAGSFVGFFSLMAAGPSPIHHRTVVLQDILGGGMGARRGLDGLDAVDTHVSNCGLLSAEVCETLYPWRIERTELIPDSGGAGRYRGGLGIRRTYRALVGQESVLYIDQTDPRFAPHGLAGGGTGVSARLAVSLGRRRRIPTKTTLFVPEGGTITVETAGGGGWGPPAKRDPDILDRDIRDGLVTRRGARRYLDARRRET